MDFIDQIKQFSKRVESLKDNIKTEEATKTSLILPFFTLLGYDVFNPFEFIPEFIADVGTKKGEKVDYAILQDNKPIIIIEAKACNSELNNKHINQLFRYFSVTNARFGILTNGILYRFYSDLKESNKMDLLPFLEINLLHLNEKSVNELKHFSKSEFDMKNILNSATELKYSAMIRKALSEQINNPSDQFVKSLIKDIYSGVKTQAVIDKFRSIIKESFNDYINDILGEKIKTVINTPSEKPITEDNNKKEKNFTVLELEILNYIKDMLIDVYDNIIFKKTDNYIALQLGNNNRKWVCRIFLRQNEHLFLLHKFGNYECEYTFNETTQLSQITELIVDVAKSCLNI